MKIMSIDASTKSFGLAIFNEKKLERYECLTASSTNVMARISKICTELKQILEEEKDIQTIILEEVRPEFGQKNLQTYKALMWLQGVAAYTIFSFNPKIKIEYVYPSSWRAKCGIKTGKGIKRDTLKAEDIRFVEDNYNIQVNDDIADAIGIGHAYLYDLSDEVNWD